MVYTNMDIVKAHEADSNFINPFDLAHLGDSSYDLSLDTTLYELASSAEVLYLDQQDDFDTIYVSRDITRGYILKPGQYVLCTIKESISLPDNVIARIMPRTRFMRLGILVANQFCNASYSGKLQLGVANLSANNVSIVEGLRIAQIVFEELHSAPSDDRLYRTRHNAAYQKESDFRGATFEGGELSERAQEIFNDLITRFSGGGE